MDSKRQFVLTTMAVNALLWLLAAFALVAGVLFYAAGTGGVVTLDFTLYGELWLELVLIYAITPLISGGVAHLAVSYDPSSRQPDVGGTAQPDGGREQPSGDAE